MSSELNKIAIKQSMVLLEDAKDKLASAKRDLKKAYIISGIAIAISIANVLHILVVVA